MKVSINNTQTKLISPEKIAVIGRSILETENKIDKEKEHFWVAGINNKNQIQYIDLVSFGSLTLSITPCEVFKKAAIEGIASIIVFHNNPSGESWPSKSDTDTTKTLVKSGVVLGIELLDHVIIGNNNFFSMKKEGVIEESMIYEHTN